MPGMLDYECKNGHIFERDRGRDTEKCRECGSQAVIIWTSPRSPHRQLQTPIVMWKYSDGSLGVAGGVDSKTPKNAERVEIRSLGEYRKYTKTLNEQLSSKERRREERFNEVREKMESQRRSNISHLMGQETDPTARALYREALEHKSNSRPPTFGEFFSTAMEMDRSNHE